MEVTNKNFLKILPEIFQSLDQCEFVAIDAEMTGVPNTYGDELRNESLESRYDRLVKESRCFSIVQYGICPVRYDENEKSYVATPYNIYIFPQKLCNVSSDSHFICNASSMTFLSEHNFDFNKWLKDGVSYLRENEECEVLEKITREISSMNYILNDNIMEVNDSELNFPCDLQPLIDPHLDCIHDLLKTPSFSYHDIPIDNDRVLKYLLLGIRIRFSRRIHFEIIKNDNGHVVVRVKRGICKERILELKKSCKYLAGFSLVIRKLLSLKKPIVGHNLILDVLMTCRQFFSDPPKKLERFKKFIHSLFPIIYDTKVMANSVDSVYSASTVLQELCCGLQTFSFSKVHTIKFQDSQHQYEFNNLKPHEAGYDAYITACCFLWLAHVADAVPHRSIDYESPNMSYLKNRLYIMNLNCCNVLNIDFSGRFKYEERVLVCVFTNPPHPLDVNEQLTGYHVFWKDPLLAFLVGYCKIKRHEIRRLKNIVHFNEAYLLSEWKQNNGQELNLGNDPIQSILTYIDNSAPQSM